MNDCDLTAFELPLPEFVISADAGYLHANEYGFKTDLLVGDFDTLDDASQKDFDGEVIRFKVEKDDTDTMLAARIAIEKGYDEIYIFGALGGRFDHMFANLQTLNFIASNNCTGSIVSGNEFITLLNPGRYDFEKKEGYTFSVFAFSEKAVGVCEKGFKYSLDDAEISFDFPIGVCNEITCDKGVISFEEGRILIVISKKQNLFLKNE